MAEITGRKLDPISKMEYVYFRDKFGAESIVQHVLSRTKIERAADEAAWMIQLEANEAAFEALQKDQ